jgi:signal transduction histidine kinase
MHKTTVRSIRNRLFLLLLRAFAVVVVLFLLLMLGTTAWVLSYPSRENPLYRLPIVARLETYYIARGSWDGVDAAFDNSLNIESNQWRAAILLDANNHIVIFHGMPRTNGPVYILGANEAAVSIIVNNKTVGKFILDNRNTPPERRFAYGFLQPLIMVSVFLALLTTLIGLLLTRRVVMPLAEVIAAAKEVANGNLQTRVRLEGLGDLRDLSDSFNQMADSIERNDRERRDLLTDIAHELRTPLTVLRGRLEGILDGIYPADEKHIVPALEETYLLERLVEDLRLLTLAESRQLHFDTKPVNLGDLAEHVLDVFQAEAQEKQITFSFERPEGDFIVMADPQRIEQVISNLVSNALRYIPEGGKVRLNLEQTQNVISVSIDDNGPGVPEEDLPHIFNRFWRSEKSRSRASGGAGLGLAIARQLVEAQGGKIFAQNLPDGGLQVRCEFPAL